MSFNVIWDPATEQELITIWLAARDRITVTAASHALEQRLAADPANEGAAEAEVSAKHPTRQERPKARLLWWIAAARWRRFFMEGGSAPALEVGVRCIHEARSLPTA